MKLLNEKKLHRNLYDRVSCGLEACEYAGVQMLVRQHGEIVSRLSMGVSDCWQQTPLAENNMFRLASMTKAVTCSAVLLAVRNGWFALDDTLSAHMPEFSSMRIGVLRDGVPVPDRPAENPIRIYQLMCHTSGVMSALPLGEALVEQMPRSANVSVSSVAEYCSRQPLVFEPGTRTAYTGSASFDILAALIERKSGMSFSAFVRENLLDPLGLSDLTFTPTEEQWQRLVSMHDRTDSKTLVTVNMGRHVYEGFPLTYTRAGGGLMGSIDDYSRFAEYLRNDGALDGVRLLPAPLARELHIPRVPDGIPGRSATESWGLGVRVIVRDAILPVGSFGWSGAYGTHFWVDPENEITAVLMKNNYQYDAHGGGRSGVQFERDVMASLD